MAHYLIQARGVLSGDVLRTRVLSADSGSLYRRQVAEELSDELGYTWDHYIVEYEVNDNSEMTLLNKYEV